MKKKFIRMIRELRKNKIENTISIVLSIIIICFILSIIGINSTLWKSIISDAWKEILITAFSIVCAACITIFIHRVIRLTMNKVEDAVKLNPDYEELVQGYKCSIQNFLPVQSNRYKIEKLKRKTFSYFDQEKRCIIPEEFIFIKRRGEKLVLQIRDDKEKFYQMPDILLSHFDENMSAHECSYIYNSILLRVDDCLTCKEANSICLFTSRTTYFDSLSTNRAVDYTWDNGLSIRRLYTFNGGILPLRDMPLSNHLGVNGIVKTKDDYIVCIHRSDKASIGKGTYSVSIGAAVQAVTAVNNDGDFTRSGLTYAIQSIIEEELDLLLKEYYFTLEDNVIAFYRDWVEGGKPQLLFYVDCILTAEKLKERFRIKKINKQIEFIKLDDLQKAIITADHIFLRQSGRRSGGYKVFPSVAGSIYIFLKYFNQ